MFLLPANHYVPADNDRLKTGPERLVDAYVPRRYAYYVRYISP